MLSSDIIVDGIASRTNIKSILSFMRTCSEYWEIAQTDEFLEGLTKVYHLQKNSISTGCLTFSNLIRFALKNYQGLRISLIKVLESYTLHLIILI